MHKMAMATTATRERRRIRSNRISERLGIDFHDFLRGGEEVLERPFLIAEDGEGVAGGRRRLALGGQRPRSPVPGTNRECRRMRLLLDHFDAATW